MNTTTHIEPEQSDQDEVIGRRRNERGASLVEYALLLALVAMLCIGAIGALGGTVNEEFDDMSTELINANSTP